MSEPTPAFDPVMLAVLSNRMDAIVREMTNTLLRAARSAVIAMSRDFSCCIVTGDGRLLATAEAAPVHVFGTHLQAQAMSSLHPDLLHSLGRLFFAPWFPAAEKKIYKKL